MKTFVVGDIHGAHKALKQVLEKASFDYKNDVLISLGDVADGWTEVAECFEELFKIKNLIYVRGNHDQWLLDWFNTGAKPEIWTSQGGRNSLLSYLKNPELMDKHQAFLNKTPFYHLDEKKRLFVHGGINPKLPLNKQNDHDMMWDRDLWNYRLNYRVIEPYKEIYVGHTTIYGFSRKPLLYGNVIFMDTGGGWEGVLSLMDIDSKKIFQSEVVSGLYPGVLGR